MEKIINESLKVDWLGKELSRSTSIHFPVPKDHSRYSQIKRYALRISTIKDFTFLPNDLVLIDNGIKDHIDQNIFSNATIRYLEPSENKLKTLDFVNQLSDELKDKDFKRTVAIGGGIIINISAYLAEKLNIDFIIFPTTLIAMSDASIGGKVRINDVGEGKFIKHAYKSFYEPNKIILDTSFLEHISEKWIRIGLAEIIKHAVYQSRPLADYLLSDDFNPFSDKQSLLRAILWTADLKRICLEIDPEESKDGSYLILRAGHDISDRLEEESGFTLDHGEAVERAILKDLEDDPGKLVLLKSVYNKFGIV